MTQKDAIDMATMIGKILRGSLTIAVHIVIIFNIIDALIGTHEYDRAMAWASVAVLLKLRDIRDLMKEKL